MVRKELSKGREVQFFTVNPWDKTGETIMHHDSEEAIKMAQMDFDIQDDCYKDPNYLSIRSKMSLDDPRFDADFWGAYFQRIDGKSGAKPIMPEIAGT